MRKMLLVSCAAVVLAGCTTNKLSTSLEVSKLTCQYLNNPLGVDAAEPTLSWEIVSTRRVQKQTAYRVLVATRKTLLADSKADLWDSGKRISDRSIHIKYGGAPLKSRMQCFWKVMVWDKSDQPSAWSTPASWGMGILCQDDWKGQWIKSDLTLFDYQKKLKEIPDHNREGEVPMWARAEKIRKMTEHVKDAPAMWMRKEFTITEKKLHRAIAYVSGLGFYELYVNGKKVNDHLLNVAAYDYGKTVPYQVHDITDFIENGDNAIGVILGNGFFNPVIPSALREYTADYINTPRLKCDLKLEFEDGTTQYVASNPSWKYTTDGPIRFNSMRAGETYDARKELGNWSSPGYRADTWKNALAAQAPTGRMVIQDIPAVRIIEKTPAISVKAHQSGWRFDVGMDNTGWVRLKVRGKAGQKITIRYPGVEGHTLGRYQTCEYICKGSGEEYFEQRFSFNGYRYIDVSGLDYTPEAQDVIGYKVVSDLDTKGTFSCSDEKLTQLQKVHLRTVRNYNVQMPMDPVREKIFWTQDVQSNFECTAFNFNIQTMYRKWQFDFIDSISPDGYVPTCVPSCFDGPGINGPWWGGMLIYNPWMLYTFYDDLDILTQSYPAMKKYLSYLDSIAADHTINWGLGDWLDAASQVGDAPGKPKSTTVPYTSTCAFFHYTDILRQTAVLLGKAEDAAYYKEKLAVIRKALHQRFYDTETGVYDKGSQTAYILALRLNIAPAKERSRIVENLKKQIAKDDFHLSVGFVGMPYLLTQLTEEGMGDFAWKIATQETYPSWFDMVFNKKKTAFMESWDGGRVQMPSLASPIGAWFYRSLGGIRPDSPGFKTFIVQPYTNNLEWVKCQYECAYGLIRSNWKKKDGELTMNITVPVNTTATVYVPGKDITEGGLAADKAEGVTFLRCENNISVFKVESGDYSFKTAAR